MDKEYKIKYDKCKTLFEKVLSGSSWHYDFDKDWGYADLFDRSGNIVCSYSMLLDFLSYDYSFVHLAKKHCDNIGNIFINKIVRELMRDIFQIKILYIAGSDGCHNHVKKLCEEYGVVD